MIITYYGGQFFKIQFGDLTIAFNPVSKDSKLKSSKFSADVILNTTRHPDFNGISSGKESFEISGPGEYEIKGIFITGEKSISNYGQENKINTIYALEIDGINVGFLGALGTKDLPDKTKIILNDVDILFVPIGGNGVLNSTEAHDLSVKLGARIIIPMHYEQMGEKDALKQFLKEGGVDNLKPAEKLTLKKKDLEGKEGEIVVFAPAVSI